MGSSHLLQNTTLGGRASRREFLSPGWYFANEQQLLRRMDFNSQNSLGSILENLLAEEFWELKPTRLTVAKTLLFGILLAITGNIFISISLNMQKYSHLRLTQQAIQKPCYRSKFWWCGSIFMGIGEIGNFAAYGFAPVMVVAPLGSVAVIGSAVIAVLFLKENFRSQSILGGTVMLVGMFLLVTFAPHVIQKVTARTIQDDLVSWQFLVYMIMEIVAFCILLYFYKRKEAKHIVVLLTMVALLASLTIISVKAVATMLTFSVTGNMQLTYPIFYLMLILMTSTCIFQVKFLNQAMEIYGSAEVIPLNYVLSTLSSVLAGAMFYHEFQGAGFLSGFMSLFGNREKPSISSTGLELHVRSLPASMANRLFGDVDQNIWKTAGGCSMKVTSLTTLLQVFSDIYWRFYNNPEQKQGTFDNILYRLWTHSWEEEEQHNTATFK